MTQITDGIEVANREKYFADFFYTESQLISLKYRQFEATFELVVRQLWDSDEDLWREETEKPAKQSPSKFDYLKFDGVENFNAQDRWIRNKKGEIELENCYGNLLIQDLQISRNKDNWRILLDFAWNTKCEFDFKKLQVKRRLDLGYADKKGEEYQYYDFQTKQPFDFYNPFRLNIKSKSCFRVCCENGLLSKH